MVRDLPYQNDGVGAAFVFHSQIHAVILSLVHRSMHAIFLRPNTAQGGFAETIEDQLGDQTRQQQLLRPLSLENVSG